MLLRVYILYYRSYNSTEKIKCPTCQKQYQNILQCFNFSGQLECEGILPTQNVFTTNKLPNMCEQAQPNNTAPSRNRYREKADEACGTNTVAASLV